jgi:hypothetical protein
MKRRTARERYFADEWPSRRPGPRWCFTDRAALRRWCRPRSHRPRCLVPSHAAPPAPAAPPLHGLDRRCCCILQRRRRCDRHSVAGSGKRRRAYGQDGSGEKLAWQIHDLISIPDLQHRTRCNAVGQPAGSRFVPCWRVDPGVMGQFSCPKSHAWSRRSHALGVIRTKT